MVAEREVKVIVYSTPACPWCYKVKEFLEEHNIPFIEKDVSADREAAYEMIAKSHQMGVPVIDVNGEIVIGFDEIKLRQLLRIED